MIQTVAYMQHVCWISRRAFFGKIIGISKINRFKLKLVLASKIFWVWDAIVSPLLYKNSVKFSKMTKIILKICSLKKNWNCWIELNSELFLSIVSFHGSYINCKLSNNITLKQQSVTFYNIFSSKTLSKKKNYKVKRKYIKEFSSPFPKNISEDFL